MNHIQLSITATESEQELLIALLADVGATGFEQTDDTLLAYFNEEAFESYAVSKLLEPYTFHQTVVAEKNWNEEWEKDFQPVVVANFCAVRAHFHGPITDVQHEIIITPKMSFGTGHHATTYMMMQEMQHLNFEGKKILDFGTGTGVLAILAEKLGAAHVSAIDNDPWSVANSLENIQANNCSNIEVTETPVLPDTTFNIVLANINRHIILQYLPHLKKTVVPKGYILFSGLFTTDAEIIVEACKENGFAFVKQKERSNWIALLFVNGI